jgi:hypothetical protein
MSPKTLKLLVVVPFFTLLGAWLFSDMVLNGTSLSRSTTWQTMASPGPLSSGHTFLAMNCVACHTPNQGVLAQSCIVCHANNQALLQRQPTAFHADVRSCVECHVEHQGNGLRPTQMNHAALSRMAVGQLQRSASGGEKGDTKSWVNKLSPHSSLPSGHSPVTPLEGALNCITCHANQDRHRGSFGTSCVQCHTTTAWTIPEFKHPPETSTSCMQCHQAPPSHYMMHFEMVSKSVAGQEHAQVRDCFKCHQTTSWNDIKGVGWYKHH